jgi:hypothetical protein
MDHAGLATATARSVGALDVIERLLPGWGAGLMSVLTQLADFWFLCVLLGLCYWRLPAHRTDVAALFATALGGLGLYRTLKHSFEAPRPETVPVDPSAVRQSFGRCTRTPSPRVALAFRAGTRRRRRCCMSDWQLSCQSARDGNDSPLLAD